MLPDMDSFLVRVWRPGVARGAGELSLCGTVEHLSSRHQTTFQTGDDLLTLLDDFVGLGDGDTGAWGVEEAPGDAPSTQLRGDTTSRSASGGADPRGLRPPASGGDAGRLG